MKMAAGIGIMLIIVGLIALAYQGITHTTHKDIVDVGPIHATKTEHKTIPLPPVLGGAALIAGVVLLASSRKTA